MSKDAFIFILISVHYLQAQGAFTALVIYTNRLRIIVKHVYKHGSSGSEALVPADQWQSLASLYRFSGRRRYGTQIRILRYPSLAGVYYKMGKI